MTALLNSVNIKAQRQRHPTTTGHQAGKENTMKNKEYIEFIKKAIETDGYKVADIANKKALEAGAITTAQYSAAARLIAEAFVRQLRY